MHNPSFSKNVTAVDHEGRASAMKLAMKLVIEQKQGLINGEEWIQMNDFILLEVFELSLISLIRDFYLALCFSTCYLELCVIHDG